ncbi:MAG: hypothetical protein ACREAC_11895 [Blastocatellia bacterium]
MRIAILAVAAFSLAACAPVDRSRFSTFEPTGNGTFRMTARGAVNLTESDHLEWLEYYIRENHICAGAYTVIDRQKIVKLHGLLGDITDVTYFGKCVS